MNQLYPTSASFANRQQLSSIISMENGSDLFRHVQLLVEFTRIGEIDTLNERYQAELYIEAKWIEKDPITEYDAKVHWNPKLLIENTFQELKETTKYELSKDLNNNTIVTEIKHLKGFFYERLELQNFPVDVQELSITVTSRLTLNEVKLITDPMRPSYLNTDAENNFVEQQKWHLFKLVKTRAVDLFDMSVLDKNTTNALIGRETVKSRHSKVMFTCYCSRKPEYYFFNAYFLIFLITVSALTIFSVDCKLPQSRLQTSYTLLLTSVSFKWVINRQLPTVSYLTSLDKYAIVCIFYLCMLCVWHSIVGSFWEPDQAQYLDFWSLVCFSVVFLFIHVCFIIWLYLAHAKIRKLKAKERDFLKFIKDLQNRQESTIAKLARI